MISNGGEVVRRAATKTHHLHFKVGISGENFHLEVPVHIVDHVELVHHRPQRLVFLSSEGSHSTPSAQGKIAQTLSTHIEDDLADQESVRQVLVAEVEMRCGSVALVSPAR